MNSPLRLRSPVLLLGAVLALSLLLLLAEPVQAATFAGVGDFFRSFARRDRVIQLCLIAMIIGLFVMLRKFDAPSRD